MAELKAPPGAFILSELEPDIQSQEVAWLFHVIARLPRVRACADLATVPIELLQERVLLRLSADEQRLWKRAMRR